MARDLGFDPVESDNYYFLSYNSEDATRVAEQSLKLFHADIPLWYDKGIDYGTHWEEVISEKIAKSQAVVFFFTIGMLKKDDSYAQREFYIAKHNGKTIYIILLDKVVDELWSQYPKKGSFLYDIDQNHYPDSIESLIERLQKDKNITRIIVNNNKIPFEGSKIVDSEYLLNNGYFTAKEISKRHVELDYLTVDPKLFPEALDDAVEGNADTWEDMVSESADCTANLIVNKNIVGYMDFLPVSPEDYIKLQTQPFNKDYVAFHTFGGRFDIFVSMFSIDLNYATPYNYILFIQWMINRIIEWKEQGTHIGKIEFSIYSNHQAKTLESLGFHLLLKNQLKGMLYEIKVEDLLNSPIVKARFNDSRIPLYKYQIYQTDNMEIVEQCLDIASSLSVNNGGILQYETAPQESDMIITAEYQNLVAGYLCLKKYPIFNDGIYIEQIAIKKDHQRLGLGRQLIKRAIKYAKENGYQEIYANCKKINEPSHSLFLSLGFKEFNMSEEQYASIGIEKEDIDKNIALIYS